MSRNFYCARCEGKPCVCDEMEFDAGFEPLEDERPGFEAFMRLHYPERDLTRFGHSYVDAKVRDRWIGWQGKARAGARVIARRVA